MVGCNPLEKSMGRRIAIVSEVSDARRSAARARGLRAAHSKQNPGFLRKNAKNDQKRRLKVTHKFYHGHETQTKDPKESGRISGQVSAPHKYKCTIP